ncbi:phage tail tape measure protein [Xanthomonas cannabis]|uniref:TP901 family phage tail tape measure protein n=1 Tax=Xanthomonas cannabis TaxID=1885674 RepID=A0ABR6JGC9_9XANT|nr:phage tail tape measure protein [Xanthomonas cannabis]MBB4591861.1 TP901 family phage tail tape measure protein [Xanthomonas cannabis]MBB5522157.1 TP901 family phage tail tape measure protein [Xanthomonas cannabis]
MAASGNLRLQVILAAVDRATGPFRRVLSGSRGVADALRQQRDALRALNAQQRDVGAFRTQHEKSRQAKAALDAQRAAVQALAQQIRAAGTPTAALNAQFERAKKLAAELKQKHQAEEAALQGLRTRLNAAGVSTTDLVTQERHLRDQIDAANTAMREQQRRLAAIAAGQQRATDIQSAGMEAVGKGVAAMAAGLVALRGAYIPIEEAMRFESAMADVRKVVDFETPQQFKEMGRDIEDLSMRLPLIPTDIAKIVAAAGQAAIPRKELLGFAQDAAKMAVAFDTTAEDAGQTMATWRTAFRMGQGQVVELADQINYLGNTGPASVKKISDVVNRIGALGEVAGLQSDPLAALGATVAGMGIESEVSATGIKNMLLTLSSGDSATKAQTDAFAKLGLGAKAMAQAMQDDAGGAIMSVLQKLRALPKVEQAATMNQLFGRESIGAIAPLLTNLELLQNNFAKVADKQRYAGSMSAEYGSRVATSANSLQLLKNTVVVVSQSIGRTLLPEFKQLTERTAAVVERVTAWIRANPTLVGTIAKLSVAGAAAATALGALLVVGGLGAAAFGQLYGLVNLLSGGTGFGGLLARLGSLAGRILPMLANGARLLLPLLGGVSLPVLAIGAAVAAVALLVWKYWGPIKAFAIGVWQGIVETAAPVLAELQAALAPLGPVWDTVAAAMGQAWAWVKQLLTPFEATTAQLHGATDAGRGFGQILGAVLVTQLQLAVKSIGWLVRAFVFVLPVIKQILGGVWQTVQGTWSLIVGVFTGNGDRIRQGLLQLWAGINLQLANWPARMLQAGADMISGLIQGIRSKLGDAGNAIASVGTGVVDRFKGLLGIHSPSRVFAQLGDFTMQGLTVGLQRGQGAPVQAVAALGNRMRAVGAGLALATATAPVAAIDSRAPLSPPARAASAAAGGNSYVIHIHAAPGMDTTALAREVARQLEERDRRTAAARRSSLRDD